MRYVVIGGGIAGVSCFEEICNKLRREDCSSEKSVTLVTASPMIKTVSCSVARIYVNGIAIGGSLISTIQTLLACTHHSHWISFSFARPDIQPTNVVVHTRVLSTFDVENRSAERIRTDAFAFICYGKVDIVDSERHLVVLDDGRELVYDRVCICTGATPRLALHHPLVLGIRDDESVDTLARQLSAARRVAILGNGGVALGLVHELPRIASAVLAHACTSRTVDGHAERAPLDAIWVIRDDYVGNTFFDSSASAFFLDRLRTEIDISVHGSLECSGINAAEAVSAAAAERAPFSAAVTVETERTIPEKSDVTSSSFRALPVERSRNGLNDTSSEKAWGGMDENAMFPYVPLPQRVRRKDRIRIPSEVAVGTCDVVEKGAPVHRSSKRAYVSDSCRASPVNAACAISDAMKPSDAGSNRCDRQSLGDTQIASSLLQHVTGASRGSDWATKLFRVEHTGDRAIEQNNGARGEHELSTGDSVQSPMSRGRLRIELNTEVVALRGEAAGAVGPLADGQWHSVAEFATALPVGIPVMTGHLAAVADVTRTSDSDAWPLFVRLANGVTFGCDFIVCATGVTPVFPRLAANAHKAASCSGRNDAAEETSQAPSRLSTAHAPSPLTSVQSATARGIPSSIAMQGSIPQLLASDGGLIVNEQMQSLLHPHVYAAGDAASVEWPRNLHNATVGAGGIGPPLWFQMRTWGQARIAGRYAGRCMTRSAADYLEDGDGGVAFELFVHATTFRGFKVILLGLFNGQGLGDAYERAIRSHVKVSGDGSVRGPCRSQALAYARNDRGHKRDSVSDVEIQMRVTPGVEYVKVVFLDGRVVGAMLIGDTDLEETLENLILNKLQLNNTAGTCDGAASRTMDLLNPDVDIEDYFD